MPLREGGVETGKVRELIPGALLSTEPLHATRAHSPGTSERLWRRMCLWLVAPEGKDAGQMVLQHLSVRD